MKIYERIINLANSLYKYKHTDCFSSLEVENVLNNIQKDVLVVSIEKKNLLFVRDLMPQLLITN